MSKANQTQNPAGKSSDFSKVVRKLVADWIERNDGNVKTFSKALRRSGLLTFMETEAEVNDPDSTYRWVRKALATGFPQKREGQANYRKLRHLHAFLGVRWPDLWNPDCATAPARLAALVPKLPPEAVDYVHDCITGWSGHVDGIDVLADLTVAGLKSRTDLWTKATAAGCTEAGVKRVVVVWLMWGRDNVEEVVAEDIETQPSDRLRATYGGT